MEDGGGDGKETKGNGLGVTVKTLGNFVHVRRRLRAKMLRENHLFFIHIRDRYSNTSRSRF